MITITTEEFLRLIWLLQTMQYMIETLQMQEGACYRCKKEPRIGSKYCGDCKREMMVERTTKARATKRRKKLEREQEAQCETLNVC